MASADIITHTKATELVKKGRDGQKKIAPNTYLFQGHNSDCFQICFHHTIIITIFSNGTYSLNSGRFRTPTTKNRLNRFAPAKIYQKNCKWCYGNDLTPFTDGMCVDDKGEVVS